MRHRPAAAVPVALLEALMRGQPVLASRDTNIEMLPEWDARILVYLYEYASVSDLVSGKKGGVTSPNSTQAISAGAPLRR